MTIENVLERIANNLGRIADALEGQNSPAATSAAPVATPAAITPAEARAANPDPMSAPAPDPVTVAPAAAPVASAAPFTEVNGLRTYALDAYNKLGAANGPRIQSILTTVGVNSIADLPADQYGTFYQQVEALKRECGV